MASSPLHRRVARRRLTRASVVGPAGALAALLTLGLLSQAAFSAGTPSAPAAVRISGADRFATAAAVSAATFPNGAPIAYVATGLDFPDALAAAAAAGGRGP